MADPTDISRLEEPHPAGDQARLREGSHRANGWTALRRVVVPAIALAGLGSGAGPVEAQRADGTYPVTLACDAAGGSGSVRASGTATIGGGRGTYEIRVGSGRETGSGVLSGGKLSLGGKGPGYEGRYAGDVSGRGGFLTGYQTGTGGKSFRRACQVILGGG